MKQDRKLNFTISFSWFIYVCQTIYISGLFLALHVYLKNILFFFEISLWLMLSIQIFAIFILLKVIEKLPVSEIKIDLIKNYKGKSTKLFGYFNIFMNGATLIAALAIKDYSMIIVQGGMLICSTIMIKLAKSYWDAYYEIARKRFPHEFGDKSNDRFERLKILRKK